MSVLSSEYISRVFKQIGEMTDHRALAVLSIAMLDDCISELLLAFFVDGTSLPNVQFKAKLDLAKALGLISKQSHVRLVALGRIRNKLGHDTDCNSFDHPTLKQYFDNGDFDYNGSIPSNNRSLIFIQVALMESMGIQGAILSTERLKPRKESHVIYKSVP